MRVGPRRIKGRFVTRPVRGVRAGKADVDVVAVVSIGVSWTSGLALGTVR